MIDLVWMCCQRGLTQFDLGVGEARFKRLFYTEIELLFDTFRPRTARGSIVALGYRLGYHLKGRIKSTPALWDAVTTVRLPAMVAVQVRPPLATAIADLKQRRHVYLDERRQTAALDPRQSSGRRGQHASTSNAPIPPEISIRTSLPALRAGLCDIIRDCTASPRPAPGPVPDDNRPPGFVGFPVWLANYAWHKRSPIG
jgi:hypothetical protein